MRLRPCRFSDRDRGFSYTFLGGSLRSLIEILCIQKGFIDLFRIDDGPYTFAFSTHLAQLLIKFCRLNRLCPFHTLFFVFPLLLDILAPLQSLCKRIKKRLKVFLSLCLIFWELSCERLLISDLIRNFDSSLGTRNDRLIPSAEEVTFFL